MFPKRIGPPNLCWAARPTTQSQYLVWESVSVARSLLPTLTASFRCAVAILSEVPAIILGTAAAMTVFAALAASLGGTLAIVSEVTGSPLPARLTGSRSLLGVIGGLAGIPRMSLFDHSSCSF